MTTTTPADALVRRLAALDARDADPIIEQVAAIHALASEARQHVEGEAARAVDDMARRLAQTDVCYCVSALVSELYKGAFEPGGIMSEDDATSLAYRQPDADDYQDADCRNVTVYQDGERWAWRDDGDTMPDDFATAVEAWQAAFNATGQDEPDGTDCLEHWLVTDWLADKLEAAGEAVARDVAGLTIWGRCTSGQAIYADAVIQRIARDVLEA
jgi:hypothetical protein